MIKIYGNGQTRWAKCVWMARELGIDFEEVIVKWSPLGGFGGEDYRTIHPFSSVPSLTDGDLKLFESQAIINYLGEKYPERGLIPKSGTVDRAIYDQWTFFCTSSLEFPLWSWFRHSYLFDDEKRNEQEIQRAANELDDCLTSLNSLIGNGEYLVGNKFSAADITMAYTLGWAASCGFVDRHIHLRTYMNRHHSREQYPRHLAQKK